MSNRTDAPVLRAFLARALTRLRWIGAAEGAAVGVALAAVFALAGWIETATWSRTAIIFAIAAATGAVARVGFRAVRAGTTALLIERRAPQSRNVVITAHELLSEGPRTQPHIVDRVVRDAERVVSTLNLAQLFPERRAVSALVAATVFAAVSGTVAMARSSDSSVFGVRASGPPSIDDVTITVTPPAYAELRDTVLRDPARVVALAGSRIRVSVRANASRVAMETATQRDTMTAAAGAFTTDIIADADGYLALEPSNSAGSGARRLIGLTVTPDAAPHVRVTLPGRDLFIDNPRRTFDVMIEASDDLALDALRLRYTKVSGSGEQFSFVDGESPITVARVDARSWRARGQLKLADLKLEPGDVLVYRGVASDRRPGAPPAESDAFIIEITAPGAIAAEGFAIDDEQDRYAISQQMVILKTQRLIARRDSLSRDAFMTEVQTIAAEQRQVRAEFVFMMGGELAEEVLAAAGITDLNEEAEAAGEDDILAGRLANQGRIALLRAIRSMSRAAAALVDADPTRALPAEQAALQNLQAAFARSRYILRALTQRERLDLTRRLTGTLAGVTRDARAVPEPERDPRLQALRSVLADVAVLGAPSEFAADAQATTARLAERLLRIDASDTALARVATQLSDAANAMARSRVRDARDHLQRAASALAAQIRAQLGSAPTGVRPLHAAQLDGALVDELRRRGGER
ncbi:MAG TPA: hypothetical protein VJR92_00940 [Gemmatimonadaceae bacterium]|nr:hypothetical protein [Gemmatimonadaceae bacterium]